MPAARELAGERRPDRVEEEVAGRADAAADDHHGRVEHGRERGDALAEPGPEGGQLLDGERVARLRALGDERPGDGRRVAARAVEELARRSASRLPRRRASRTRAVPLP